MCQPTDISTNKVYLPRGTKLCRHWYDPPQMIYHLNGMQLDAAKEGQAFTQQRMELLKGYVACAQFISKLHP